MSSIWDEQSVFPVLQPLFHIIFYLSKQTRQVDDHARTHKRFTFFMRYSARQKMKIVLKRSSIFSTLQFTLIPLQMTVWPALLPPAQRAVTSMPTASKSTSLPFPSSPHCAPSTTLTLFLGAFRFIFLSVYSDLVYIRIGVVGKEILLDLESRINAISRVPKRSKFKNEKYSLSNFICG